MRKNVLILGGTGFIGSHVTKQFVKNSYNVITLDSFISYFWPPDQQTYKSLEYRKNFLLKGSKNIRGNVLNSNFLQKTISEIKPEYIINLAALPLASHSIEASEEAFDSITVSTKNLLEILKSIKIKKLVHISSSMIYGNFSKKTVSENEIPDPIEIYGANKLISEILVKTYSKRYGIPYNIIRPSAVYGPTDTNKRVIQIYIENAINGKISIARNPTKNYLDFTFVEELALVIYKCTTSPIKNKIYNATRGNSRSLMEVIKIIKSYFKEFKYEVKKDVAYMPKRGTLSNIKVSQDLKYNFKINLEEGIKKYINFYLD